MTRIYSIPDSDKEKIVSLYQSGNSAITIRKIMGYTRRCRIVEKTLREAGVEILQGKRKIPLSKEKEIIGLYLDGMSTYKLAEIYPISFGAICQLLERNGIERRDNRALTNEEELQVIQEYESGKPLIEVGAMFDIHATTIPLILERHGKSTRSAGHNSRIYSLDESAFDLIDNEQAAYWLGFIYADGSNSGDGFRVALSVKDEIQLIRIKEFLKAESPIKHTTTKSPQGKILPVCQLDVFSKRIASRLADCGIVSGRNEFHKTLTNLHSNVYRHFIRGLVDGDGAIDTRLPKCNARIRLLGQEDILSWIRSVFNEVVGTSPNQRIYQRLGIQAMDYGGSAQARSIIRWLYSDTDLYLERKLDKVKDWWNK